MKWQIFYIDEEDDHRVYLIAKDFAIPPITQASPAPNQIGDGYGFGAHSSDTSMVNNYAGLVLESDFTNKFLSEYIYSSGHKGRINLKMTQYMLDEGKWAEYKNETLANQVMGGPTVPLFIASLNDVSKKQYKMQYSAETYGYQVTGSAPYDCCGTTGTVSWELYFRKINNSNSKMFLASPGFRDDDFIAVAQSRKC